MEARSSISIDLLFIEDNFISIRDIYLLFMRTFVNSSSHDEKRDGKWRHDDEEGDDEGNRNVSLSIVNRGRAGIIIWPLQREVKTQKRDGKRNRKAPLKIPSDLCREAIARFWVVNFCSFKFLLCQRTTDSTVAREISKRRTFSTCQ